MDEMKRVANFQQWNRLGALMLTVGVILGYGLWGMDWPSARWFQVYWGYYFCLCALILFGGFLVAELRLEPMARLRARWREPPATSCRPS